MESYEKRYNKALERARQIKNGEGNWRYSDLIEITPALEEVFPELAESEDERIRKDIVAAVEMRGDLTQARKSEIYAYLEKQKEQKPDLLTKYVYSKEDKKFIQDCANILVANDYIASAERLLSMFEQKPVEWSKEDEEMRQGCIDSVEYELLDNGKDDEIKTDPRIIWLKSLPLNLKKKNEDVAKLCSNEWSEEAKEAKETIIAALTVANMTTDCKRRAKKWLQSLRPSWKPSEDEERLINTSISFLKDFADKGYENAVECIDWLKSKLNGDACK